MQRMKFILMAFVLLAESCSYKYKYTVKLCDNKFYAEVYNINPAGVDEVYLTDSTSFMVNVGKFDNEHEIFKYICYDDSIRINKMAQDSTGVLKLVDSKVLSISYLKKNKKNIKESLFEFK